LYVHCFVVDMFLKRKFPGRQQWLMLIILV
jgi:hypothetical protein